MLSAFRRATLTEKLLAALLAVNVLGFAAVLYRASQPPDLPAVFRVMVEKPY